MPRYRAKLILKAVEMGWTGVYTNGLWRPITVGMIAEAQERLK